MKRKICQKSPVHGPGPAQPDRAFPCMMARHGFTLVELLVVISIISVLVAILIPSLGKARRQAKRTVCFSNMRQMGIALGGYLINNENRLPPSSCHENDPEKYWLCALAKHTKQPLLFRCPSDKSKLSFVDWTQPLAEQLSSHPEGMRYSSYALNNLLDPIVYDVPGNNGQFNNVLTIPHPQSCIWILEAPDDWTGEDHPHPEYWSGNIETAKKFVAWQRHINKSNYMFIDLHVESMEIEETYDLDDQCLWFPESAPTWPDWTRQSPF